MKRIMIADRTLCRDEGSYSFKERLEIARKLEALGVDAVELPEIASERADTLLVKTVASFVKDSVISVAAGSTPESVALAFVTELVPPVVTFGSDPARYTVISSM